MVTTDFIVGLYEDHNDAILDVYNLYLSFGTKDDFSLCMSDNGMNLENSCTKITIKGCYWDCKDYNSIILDQKDLGKIPQYSNAMKYSYKKDNTIDHSCKSEKKRAIIVFRD